MAAFEVTFIDVGQGDSTLVRFPDGTYMLVDVFRCPGRGTVDLFKLLDDVLPDGENGRKRLDHLVFTHAHDDHITGGGELYDRYEVCTVWLPQHENRKVVGTHFEEYQRIEEEHPDDRIYRPKGSRSPLSDVDVGGDDISIRCFSPPGWIDVGEDLSEEDARARVHEYCMVLRIAYNGVSVLLTGDSDAKCWKRIVDYYDGRDDPATGVDVIDSTVLHASHHGSRSFFKEGGEDGEAWLTGLDAIAPEAVVVSVAHPNRYEHPHEDMMEAYREAAGADNAYETREHNTVVLEVDEDGAPQITIDNGRFADEYGWDDEDDGTDAREGGEGGGGLAKVAIVGGAALAGAAAAAAARRGRPRTRLDDEPAA